MSDYEMLLCIAKYLNDFDQDLAQEYRNASDDVRFIVNAKISVLSEIIDTFESITGIDTGIGSFGGWNV